MLWCGVCTFISTDVNGTSHMLHGARPAKLSSALYVRVLLGDIMFLMVT